MDVRDNISVTVECRNATPDDYEDGVPTLKPFRFEGRDEILSPSKKAEEGSEKCHDGNLLSDAPK